MGKTFTSRGSDLRQALEAVREQEQKSVGDRELISRDVGELVWEYVRERLWHLRWSSSVQKYDERISFTISESSNSSSNLAQRRSIMARMFDLSGECTLGPGVLFLWNGRDFEVVAQFTDDASSTLATLVSEGMILDRFQLGLCTMALSKKADGHSKLLHRVDEKIIYLNGIQMFQAKIIDSGKSPE